MRLAEHRSASTGELSITVWHLGGGNYEVRAFGPGLLWTSGSDEAGCLRLPWQDHDRALVDGVGFLAAFADETSGAGTYVPELAPWADQLACLADDLEGPLY